MACAEFVEAINWSKQSVAKEKFPVTAYLTKHFGAAGKMMSAQDAVHYASGEVVTVNSPSPHLAGSLKVSKNTDQDGKMVFAPNLTYDVELFPDGTLHYLMKLNGKPVGGMPPTKVQATCVNGVLLTAATGSEVVAVGVARWPSIAVPQ